jgi:hypothetical protein
MRKKLETGTMISIEEIARVLEMDKRKLLSIFPDPEIRNEVIVSKWKGTIFIRLKPPIRLSSVDRILWHLEKKGMKPIQEPDSPSYVQASVSRVVSRFLIASSRVRVDPKTRNAIARDFKAKGLDGNGVFQKAQQGFSRAVEVLQEHGIELDEVVNSFVFNQDDGNFRVDLALTNPEDSFSPIPISNSVMVISFHKRGSGSFEVLAYLS